MQTELKPCPFCGGAPEHGNRQVWCPNEECPAFSADASTEAWNKRPTPPPEAGAITALQEVIDNIPDHILREHRVVYEARPGVLDSAETYMKFPRFIAAVQRAKELLSKPQSREEMNPVICEVCKARIKADTDDNYNSEHTKIQCEECRHWQWVTYSSSAALDEERKEKP